MQTATNSQPSTLTYDRLQELLEPILHKKAEIALGGVHLLWGMKYLAVGGTDVWDIWVKFLKPALDPDDVDCIVILNVEFRRSRYIPKDAIYVIRVPHWRDVFLEYL